MSAAPCWCLRGPRSSGSSIPPVPSTVRGAPSEVVIGVAEGLKNRSAVNLDHVQTVEQRRLGSDLGTVSPAIMKRVCTTLAVAVGCER